MRRSFKRTPRIFFGIVAVLGTAGCIAGIIDSLDGTIELRRAPNAVRSQQPVYFAVISCGYVFALMMSGLFWYLAFAADPFDRYRAPMAPLEDPTKISRLNPPAPAPPSPPAPPAAPTPPAPAPHRPPAR